MKPAALPPARPEADSSPCPRCVQSVQHVSEFLRAFADGIPDRAVYVGCACSGRALSPLWQHRAQVPMTAASVVKLSWTLAALRAHRAGAFDLLAPRRAGTLPTSDYRDGLAALRDVDHLPWVTLLGLGLVTSANPVFDDLAQVPELQSWLSTLPPGVTVGSGFSDADLSGPVYDNLVTAACAAETLLAVLREAHGELQPIVWGLANGARTTRLVRDLEGRPGLPREFYSANKTGTLHRVRNDVAALVHRDGVLVVATLTSRQPMPHEVDSALAEVGARLADARFSLSRQSDRGR